MFDIDLSPLGNSEQEKSQQLKGIRVINVGTSNIRNIDILLVACQYGLYPKVKLKEIIKSQINRIFIEGFTVPNKMNEEIYNFMLGLSGVGYEMLRIYE